MHLLRPTCFWRIAGFCLTAILFVWSPVVNQNSVAADAAQNTRTIFDFNTQSDGPWIGRNFWANRLQDWCVNNGRIEMTEGAMPRPLRTIHLLTHRLGDEAKSFEVSVSLGSLSGGDLENNEMLPTGYVGLLVGVGKGQMNPSAASLVQWAGNGAGVFVGMDAHGRALIHDFEKPLEGLPKTSNNAVRDVLLTLRSGPSTGGTRLEVTLTDAASGKLINRAEATFPNERLTGNIAMAATGGKNHTRYWFDDLVVGGPRVTHHLEDAFGPVASIHYTLSASVLKLTAQMLPVSGDETTSVFLQVKEQNESGAGRWRSVSQSEIIKPGYTATFRVEPWPSDKEHEIRLVYNDQAYTGVVRRDPIDKDTVALGVINCLHQNSHRLGGGDWGGGQSQPNDWVQGTWFPHKELVEKLAVHEPDIMFFAGDQIYESSSPTPVDQDNLELDYLYKWYLYCRTFGQMTRDYPSVVIPDDHDMYQGNLWGAGGRPAKKDHHGGYVRPAWFVKMVERTQTSHLPDPYDPTPTEQGIGVYYTGMTYGGVGFAIIEDRKFKSGSHDPETGKPVDVESPSLILLGDRQLNFLRDWAGDWEGQQLKAVLSQTVFAMPHTHTGAELRYISRDDDANGFPSPARDRAVDAIRRAFAVHINGDQHLATLLKHGIDDHGDAFWSFCGPAAANFWPRAWAPNQKGPYQYSRSTDEYVGNYLDGWGNRITMAAVANPGGAPSGREPKDLYDRAIGYGIVRFNKPRLQITFECWPRHADPNEDNQQYPGWPRTVELEDNYARKPIVYLPTVRVHGLDRPVIQVNAADSGELIYARRFIGPSITPPVFKSGTYTISVGEPGTVNWHTIENIEVGLDTDGNRPVPIDVDFQ